MYFPPQSPQAPVTDYIGCIILIIHLGDTFAAKRKIQFPKCVCVLGFVHPERREKPIRKTIIAYGAQAIILSAFYFILNSLLSSPISLPALISTLWS